jgi:hypothetical protein
METAAEIEAVSPALESSAKRPARRSRFHSLGTGSLEGLCWIPSLEIRRERFADAIDVLIIIIGISPPSEC